MAANFANWSEDNVINWLLGAAVVTRPTAWNVALYTAAPGEDGLGGTEVAGGGYARQATTFGAAAGGSASNSAAVNFPQATAGWGYVWWATVIDQAGNHLLSGPLSTVARRFIAGATDVTNNTFTSTGHGLTNGDRVCLEADDQTLPTGVAERTLYYVVGATTDTFQLSTTSGGAAIDITAAGGGVARQLNGAREVLANDTFSIAAGSLTVTLR